MPVAEARGEGNKIVGQPVPGERQKVEQLLGPVDERRASQAADSGNRFANFECDRRAMRKDFLSLGRGVPEYLRHPG